MTKTAVIVFNLGGPDSLKAVRPFLFNLFNDRAIINLPQPFRFIVAFFLSLMRRGRARAMYQQIGGKSPLLDLTTAQAQALEAKLKPKGDYKVFVSMRYWHPMSDIVVKNVKAWKPDHIILLPLYPQFSTTTTGSSFTDWDAACKKSGLSVPSTRICCYPIDRDFVTAHVKLLKDMYWKASEEGKPRVLFSAHGLPEKIIASGDPYQWQIERTVAAIRQVIAIEDMDYAVCYQSRVGPMHWIGPSTEEEIIRASLDKKAILVVPIAFVSEHSETLVELDIDYRKLAKVNGARGYWRVPALGVEPFFIDALAGLCLNVNREEKIASFSGARFCQRNFDKCVCVG